MKKIRRQRRSSSLDTRERVLLLLLFVFVVQSLVFSFPMLVTIALTEVILQRRTVGFLLVVTVAIRLDR